MMLTVAEGMSADMPMRDLRVRAARRPYRPRRPGAGWPVRMAGRVPVRALLAIVMAGCMVSTFALAQAIDAPRTTAPPSAGVVVTMPVTEPGHPRADDRPHAAR